MHSTPPLGLRVSPSEYRHDVWYDKKTRMVCLPDGEKILKIYLFVLTITNVTDGHTQTLHDSVGKIDCTADETAMVVRLRYRPPIYTDRKSYVFCMSLGDGGLCWAVFARNRDTAVPAEGNGDLQTLICVLVARPRRCLTLSNPVP